MEVNQNSTSGMGMIGATTASALAPMAMANIGIPQIPMTSPQFHVKVPMENNEGQGHSPGHDYGHGHIGFEEELEVPEPEFDVVEKVVYTQNPASQQQQPNFQLYRPRILSRMNNSNSANTATAVLPPSFSPTVETVTPAATPPTMTIPTNPNPVPVIFVATAETSTPQQISPGGVQGQAPIVNVTKKILVPTGTVKLMSAAAAAAGAPIRLQICGQNLTAEFRPTTTTAVCELTTTTTSQLEIQAQGSDFVELPTNQQLPVEVEDHSTLAPIVPLENGTKELNEEIVNDVQEELTPTPPQSQIENETSQEDTFEKVETLPKSTLVQENGIDENEKVDKITENGEMLAAADVNVNASPVKESESEQEHENESMDVTESESPNENNTTNNDTTTEDDKDKDDEESTNANENPESESFESEKTLTTYEKRKKSSGLRLNEMKRRKLVEAKIIGRAKARRRDSSPEPTEMKSRDVLLASQKMSETVVRLLGGKRKSPGDGKNSGQRADLVLNESTGLIEEKSDVETEKPVLCWEDGVGALPGSDLKFRVNEFGVFEVIQPGGGPPGAPNQSSDEDRKPLLDQKLMSVPVNHVNPPENPPILQREDEIKIATTPPTPDQTRSSPRLKKNPPGLLFCQNCAHFGMTDEFVTDYCSLICLERKKAEEENGGRSGRGGHGGQGGPNSGGTVQRLRTVSEESSTDTSTCTGTGSEGENGVAEAENPKIPTGNPKKSEKIARLTNLPMISPDITTSLRRNSDSVVETATKNNNNSSNEKSVRLTRNSLKSTQVDRKRSFEKVLNTRMPHLKQSAGGGGGGTDGPTEDTQSDSGSGEHAHEFDWKKYLDDTKSKAAPLRLFRQPAMPEGNPFKKGMMLEAIDPQHQSLFCAACVVETQGYRLRIRLIGFSESYDFWVNADSDEIFPCGWCEENGQELQPPPGEINFSWHQYLVEKRSPAADRHFFPISREDPLAESTVRVGMKLEAVDIRNQKLVCVASVAGVIGERFLVHFDSWDSMYDYWTDLTSPYIHPVGWCEREGETLVAPNNFNSKTPFTWDKYLRETKSLAMPGRLFQPLPPVCFKTGMKLECVDKRNPFLVRVATVTNVHGHELGIHFDGWSEIYDYDVYELSPDIHPVGWCAHTGHPLQPPPNQRWTGPCPTFGCLGLGHIKGPKFLTHNTDKNCPYAEHNYLKDWPQTDRLVAYEKSFDRSRAGSEEKEKTINKRKKKSASESSESPSPPKRTRQESPSGKQKNVQDKDKVVPKLDLPPPQPQPQPSASTSTSDPPQAQPQLPFPQPQAKAKAKIPSRERSPKKIRNKISKARFRKEVSELSESLLKTSLDTHMVNLNTPRTTPKNEAKNKNNTITLLAAPKLILTATPKSTPFASGSGSGSGSAASVPSLEPQQQQQQLVKYKLGPMFPSEQDPDLPVNLAVHILPLRELVGDLNTDTVSNWLTADVKKFVSKIPGCTSVANRFSEQMIDGESFLLLNQGDLTEVMGFKMGPVIKLAHVIRLIHSNFNK